MKYLLRYAQFIKSGRLQDIIIRGYGKKTSLMVRANNLIS